ncbi:hypothetical protein K438DRAFT_1970823 [Mycena galopus ATCC 62051]|nr:hypothetical protein K438DRAFT_1970823 [Mycena galopus ATCC 62051]
MSHRPAAMKMYMIPKPPPTKAALAQQARRRREHENRKREWTSYILHELSSVRDYPVDSASDGEYTKRQARGAGPIREVSNNDGDRRTRDASGRHITRTLVMLGSIDNNATLEVTAMQYISATKEHEVFPFRCLILDSPKWPKCKPIPANNKFVSVTDFLIGVVRDDDHMGKHFIVDVDQVVFGQSDSA